MLKFNNINLCKTDTAALQTKGVWCSTCVCVYSSLEHSPRIQCLLSEWLPRIYGNMCVGHAFALNAKSSFMVIPPTRVS